MTDILPKFSLAGKNALVVCPENPYGRELAEGFAAAGFGLTFA